MRGWVVGLVVGASGCGGLSEAVGGAGEDETGTASTTGGPSTNDDAPSPTATNPSAGDASVGSDDGSGPGSTSAAADDTTAGDTMGPGTTDGTDAGSTTGEGGESDGTSGGVAATPETCAELGSQQPGLPDGEYTLYVDGDVGQPWTAYCVDLDGTAQAYLPLPAGAANNFSEYAHNSGGVQTEFTRVAIDEVALQIDVDDLTFAASSGSVNHSGDLVTEMSFGVAMSCTNGLLADARVDLTGTAFTVTSGWCTAGTAAGGQGIPADGGRVVEITGGGFCGWTAPSLPMDCPYNPFNGNAGSVISLQYSP